MSYADVNGLHLYYETHGNGRPMILLHGGLFASDIFDPLLPAFTQKRQVIAVDLQAHGRTADIDRPIDVRLMAGDIAALIEHLELDRPDLVGYSLGGGTTFFLTVQRPELVGKLVVIATAMRDTAYYPEIRAQQGQLNAQAAEFLKSTAMYESYARLAPRVEDWPVLVDKIGKSMAGGFDYTSELSKLQRPTMFVFADGDMSSPSHAVEIYEMLGGGQRDGGWDRAGLPMHQLAIIPGETHYSVGTSPKLPPLVKAFLDEV